MTEPTLPLIEADAAEAPTDLVVLDPDEVADWRAAAGEAVGNWLDFIGFKPEAGRQALIPASAAGRDLAVAVARRPVAEADQDPWGYAGLAFALPARDFRVDPALPAETAHCLALGWAIGAYRFRRYKTRPDREPARLVWPDSVDRGAVERAAGALWWARDLINTPAEDLGPEALAQQALDLAARHGAEVSLLTGEELLTGNFPMVHAVGRASDEAPRLVDISWGPAEAPRVALIGKGVCFDSGGLDLKTAAGMANMKKDMGGAAATLGLARMVMQAGLNLRLRVLVPIVENAVAGNAFRPMDVLKSRRGLTVEIGNTDAEGRLILADALAAASEDSPQLIVDFSTLTGAQRIALGFDIAGLFANDDRLAERLVAAGRQTGDPLWRLPLWQPYERLLNSPVADLSNAPQSSYGGAITAALFLQRFVGEGVAWAHIDGGAWILNDRPGKPKGGEVQGMLAVFALLAADYPPA